MFDINNIDFRCSQRVFVWGGPGSGKTLLLCYLGQLAEIQSLDFIYDSYDEVDFLNSIGFSFSKNYEHLCFSNFEINSDGSPVPDLKSYFVNPYRLGLKGKFKTDLYPPYSIFFITEFQNYVPSSMNDYLRSEELQYYQTSRHPNLSFFVDAQRPTDVAKKIRDLFDVFIECVNVEELIDNNEIVGHKWKLRIIYGGLVLDEYLKTKNFSLCKEINFVVHRCLYGNYDSYFCKFLHYKGRENQDFNIKTFDKVDSDILSVPNGYFISKQERTKNDEDSEVIF